MSKSKKSKVESLFYNNKFLMVFSVVMAILLWATVKINYSEELTRVVLVPTWDEAGKYYMGRTKVGIDELSVLATSYSDYVTSNEKEIMDNNLLIDKMSAGNEDSGLHESVDLMADAIYDSIKGFEKEAIKAGREYSSHKMNQCIAVSIYGISIMNELKTLVLFAIFAYAAFMLRVISKKFPKKA